MGGRSENKAGYFEKLKGLLEEYKSIFIVTVDNVSSQQMHEIRHSLRGEGVVLMGKNTMVRSGPRTLSAIEHMLTLNDFRFVAPSRASSLIPPSTSVSFLSLRGM